MKTRVLSGIFLLLVMGSALFLGGWYLFFLCLFISLFGLFELYRVFKIEKSVLGIVGYSTTILYYVALLSDNDKLMALAVILGLMGTMTAYVITFPKYIASQVMCCIFGVMYVSVMLSYIYRTRTGIDGIYVVWLIFVSSWVSDTFAYFTGVLFGKHKMTPKLSPKKSIEGAVGGTLISTIVGAVYGYFVSGYISEVISFPALTFAIASFAGALLSIVGDLAASAIKRNYEIKDYGRLIPGHGGILDRFDSVIFTAPAVFWAVYIINIFMMLMEDLFFRKRKHM